MQFWQIGMTISDMEKMVIMKAYSFYKENKTQTAKSLGISIRTLDNKLSKYFGDARKKIK